MKLAGGELQSVLKVLIGEGFVVSILEDTPTATATLQARFPDGLYRSPAPVNGASGGTPGLSASWPTLRCAAVRQ